MLAMHEHCIVNLHWSCMNRLLLVISYFYQSTPIEVSMQQFISEHNIHCTYMYERWFCSVFKLQQITLQHFITEQNIILHDRWICWVFQLHSENNNLCKILFCVKLVHWRTNCLMKRASIQNKCNFVSKLCNSCLELGFD